MIEKLIIILFITRQLSAQVIDCKTIAFNNIDSALANVPCVESFDARYYSKHNFFLPKTLLKFRNLKILNLGGIVTQHINTGYDAPHIVEFSKSKLFKIPWWICRFDNLIEINLIGNSKLNRNCQIRKLKRAKHLEVLRYTPSKINNRTIKSIKLLRGLKVLYIDSNYTIKLSDVNRLRTALPNCEIDYNYFTDDINNK